MPDSPEDNVNIPAQVTPTGAPAHRGRRKPSSPHRAPTPAERAAMRCPAWCTSGHGIWAGDPPEPEHAHDYPNGVSIDMTPVAFGGTGSTQVRVFVDPRQSFSPDEAIALADELREAMLIAIAWNLDLAPPRTPDWPGEHIATADPTTRAVTCTQCGPITDPIWMPVDGRAAPWCPRYQERQPDPGEYAELSCPPWCDRLAHHVDPDGTLVRDLHYSRHGDDARAWLVLEDPPHGDGLVKVISVLADDSLTVEEAQAHGRALLDAADRAEQENGR